MHLCSSEWALHHSEGCVPAGTLVHPVEPNLCFCTSAAGISGISLPGTAHPAPLPALPWDSKSWKRQRRLMGFAEAASSVTASCLLSQACFLNLYLCIIKH